MATNCKDTVNKVTLPDMEKYTSDNPNIEVYTPQVDNIVIPDIPDVEIPKSDVEYKNKAKVCNLLTDDDISKLKKKALDTNGKNENMKKDVSDVFDTLMDKVEARLSKLFCDANISGEDAGDAISRSISSVLNSSIDFVDRLYNSETDSDKLAKLIKANNDIKSGCILDEQHKVAVFEGSDTVLTDKLRILDAQAMEAYNKYLESNSTVYEAMAQAKIAKFKSTDEYLDMLFKKEYYQLNTEIAKGILAEFESSTEVLNSRYAVMQLQQLEEEQKAKIAVFEASDTMLSYKESLALYEAKIKEFESSDAVISLKQSILENQNQEAYQKVAQIKAQINLVMKQKDGFHLDSKIKLLGILMDGWSKAYMNGLEAIPSVISNDTITKLFDSAGTTSDGYNGGKYKRDIFLTNHNFANGNLTIGFGWDSGIANSKSSTLLSVVPNWTELANFPVEVNSSGHQTLSLSYPTDGRALSVVITAKTTYYQNVGNIEDETNEISSDCCTIGCPEKFIRTSQYVYSIPAGTTCPEGTHWDIDTGTCVPDCPDGQHWDSNTHTCVDN